MIKGVHAVGLAVVDVELTLAALGAATLLERLDGAAGLVRGPNVHLELVAVSGDARPRPVHQTGLAHLCIQGRDIGPLRRALQQGGVDFLSEPVDLGTGFSYAYGRDRNGVLFETEGAPFAPAEPRAWFGHMAFVTPDLGRLCGFYAALTGRPRVDGPRLRNNRRYDAVTGFADVDLTAAWAPGGALSLEFWRYDNPEAPPRREDDGPGWTHLTFETDDVDADLEHAAALGAAVERPAEEHPHGRSAEFRDPDGNRVRLIQWAGGARAFSIDHLPHPDILARVREAQAAAAA